MESLKFIAYTARKLTMIILMCLCLQQRAGASINPRASCAMRVHVEKERMEQELCAFVCVHRVQL